ncbi:ComEC/Rec2 family competence protein [Limisalsivibrio acetivorans]|uniref:ComEC/Rec2 family competence protein n=1 Tax=Limisalsivibrio acetivorans TaxID=1304888 RepID=UPI0003B47F10|nr:ComEC/Rec2 family competence protein [Limisalsivibrio acetivorans]
MLSDKLKARKTEAFLLCAIAYAFATATYTIAQLLAAPLILLIFLRGKAYIITAIFAVFFILFSTFCLIVTDEKPSGKSVNLWNTNRGTYLTPPDIHYKPGELIIGKFARTPYREAAKPLGERLAPGYLKENKVYAVLKIPVVSSILEYRSELSERLYSLSGGRLKLTQAILLGDRRYITSETRDTFLKAGLSHMLAISGMHVGLVAAVCIMLFAFLPKKFSMGASSILLLCYLPMAGFKVPVMRAVLFASAFIWAMFIDYRANLTKLTMFTGGMILLIAPRSIISPSFLLSFSAVYGISMLSFKGGGGALQLLRVGIMASSFTLPIAMLLFGSVNPAGIVNTLADVPVTYFHLAAGIAGIFFPAISAEPLALIESFHMGLVTTLAEYTGFMFTLKNIGIGVFALSAAYLIAVTRTRYPLLAGVVLILPLLPQSVPQGLHFPDVGSYRGFVHNMEDRREVYFSGSYGSFVFSFLPFVAHKGGRDFDYGDISIYGGSNTLLTVKKEGTDYAGLCLNNTDCSRGIVYMTRSNTLKCDKLDKNTHYFIYKNDCSSDNITELKETGSVSFRGG